MQQRQPAHESHRKLTPEERDGIIARYKNDEDSWRGCAGHGQEAAGCTRRSIEGFVAKRAEWPTVTLSYGVLLAVI